MRMLFCMCKRTRKWSCEMIQLSDWRTESLNRRPFPCVLGNEPCKRHRRARTRSLFLGMLILVDQFLTTRSRNQNCIAFCYVLKFDTSLAY